MVQNVDDFESKLFPSRSPKITGGKKNDKKQAKTCKKAQNCEIKTQKKFGIKMICVLPLLPK